MDINKEGDREKEQKNCYYTDSFAYFTVVTRVGLKRGGNLILRKKRGSELDDRHRGMFNN